MRGQRRQHRGGPGAGPGSAASAGPAPVYFLRRNAVVARATRRPGVIERANGPRGSDPLRQPPDTPSRLAALARSGRGRSPLARPSACSRRAIYTARVATHAGHGQDSKPDPEKGGAIPVSLHAGSSTCDGGLASAPSRRYASLRPGRAGLAALTAPHARDVGWHLSRPDESLARHCTVAADSNRRGGDP